LVPALWSREKKVFVVGKAGIILLTPQRPQVPVVPSVFLPPFFLEFIPKLQTLFFIRFLPTCLAKNGVDPSECPLSFEYPLD